MAAMFGEERWGAWLCEAFNGNVEAREFNWVMAHDAVHTSESWWPRIREHQSKKEKSG